MLRRLSILLAAALALAAQPVLAQSSAQPVQGPTASGATGVGNPVPSGCVYQATMPTLTDLQRTENQCDASGGLDVRLHGAQVASADAMPNGTVTSINYPNDHAGSVRPLQVVIGAFNGVTWDRVRGDTNGIATQPALSANYWSYAAVSGGIVSSTADVAVKTAAGASVRNYVCTLDITHDLLSAATEIVAKDGATVIWRSRLQTPATDVSAGAGKMIFTPCLKGTANTAVNVALITSVTGSVYVNATGYTGS